MTRWCSDCGYFVTPRVTATTVVVDDAYGRIRSHVEQDECCPDCGGDEFTDEEE